MKNEMNILNEKIAVLESKLSFQEDIIETLNEIVSKLQFDLINLNQKIAILSKKINLTEKSNIVKLSEEIPPPHY